MVRGLTKTELDRLLNRIERKLSRDMLVAFQRVRQGLPIGALERAILARDVEVALRSIGLTPIENALAAIQQELPPLREAGWSFTVKDLPNRLQALPIMEVTLAAKVVERPDIIRAITEQDLRRIRAVTTETREAIRDVLTGGLREGTHPTTLARVVRDLIGLNRNQARQVQAFRARLVTEGRDSAQVARMVDRKTQLLTNLRARTIAQTQTMRALNEGQRLQRERLVAEGVIEGDDWEQEWVTADDERTCLICLPLHGQRAPIGGTFVTSIGTVDAPPAHVNCRCVTRTVLKGFRKGESPAPARERILSRLGRFARA